MINVHRLDDTGEILSTIERPWLPVDTEPYTRVVAGENGELALFGMAVFGAPVLEAIDAADATLWTWLHPAPIEGLLTKHVARTPAGELLAIGENYINGDYLWIYVLDPQGQPGPMIGGPNAAAPLFDMHVGGVAITEAGNMVLGLWLVHPGFNDLWIAELTTAGEIVWQTQLSGDEGYVINIMRDAEGSIFAAVEGVFGSHLYKLDAAGQELWAKPVALSIQGAGILARVEPILAGNADGQKVVHRFDGNGELLEVVPIGPIMAREIVGDDSCRVVLGGYPAHVLSLQG